jgi:hypothetical protein
MAAAAMRRGYSILYIFAGLTLGSYFVLAALITTYLPPAAPELPVYVTALFLSLAGATAAIGTDRIRRLADTKE